MKWIKLAVESRSWIGICAMGTYWFTCYSVSELNLNWILGIFIWASTSGLYGLLSFLKDPNNRLLVRSSLLHSGVSVVLGIYLKVYELAPLLIPLLIIGVFYGYTPFSKFKGLRTVPFLKIFLVASVWILSTMVFPIVYSEVNISEFHIILLAAEWIFLISVTIPFDMRDLKLDTPEMKTIPQVIGFKAAKKTSLVLMILHITLISVYGHLVDSSYQFFISIVVYSLTALYILYKNQKNRSQLYYTGIIDGLLFLQGGLMLAFL